MKNRKKITGICCAVLAAANISYAAADSEKLDSYELNDEYITADKARDKFGNPVTEQSYYRTGGDVDVITREDIEKNHYDSLSAAVKKIPGVRVSETGYHGVDYGDGWAYNNTISINGDAKVVVLIDGRRVDNSVSSMINGQSSTNAGGSVVLDNMLGIDSVENIEVIKGAGASVYGSDATGGVINIITRKSVNKSAGSIDISTGSWNKHNYSLNYSGTQGEKQPIKYFLNVNRQMSGDSKYHDGQTDKDYTYLRTDYKDDSVFFKLEKDFDKQHNLRFTLNHGNGVDGIPYMAPDYTHDPKENFSPYGTGGTDATNPGYRNRFLTIALTGGRYSHYNKNDYDFTYTFNKVNGMESFLRYYWYTRRYGNTSEKYFTAWPDETIYPGGIFNPQWQQDNWNNFAITSWNRQEAKGLQLQLAKSVGKHDLITSWTYDKASYASVRLTGTTTRPAGATTTERNSISGYVQDKIHLSDKWELTPSLRYVSYQDESTESPTGGKETINNTSSAKVTPIISTQYAFDDKSSTYLSWAQIFRPIKQSDYSATTMGAPLEDEKGYVMNWGIKRECDDKTNLFTNIAYTNMSNMIGKFAVYRDGDTEATSYNVNAKQEKKNFNIGINHQFNENLTLSGTYSYVSEKVKGKGDYYIEYGAITSSGGSRMSVDNILNKITPPNQYTLDLAYDNRKLHSNLSFLMYTGASRECYTDNRFLVVNWSTNYDVSKDLTAYVAVNNLFNEAYQTKYAVHTGIGAYPGAGRCVMLGMKYKF